MAAKDDDSTKRMSVEQRKRRESEVIADQAVPAPDTTASPKGKQDAVRVNTQPDEFGLPTRKPRRRNYSLEELESPEDARSEAFHELKLKQEETDKANAEAKAKADAETPGAAEGEEKDTVPEIEDIKPKVNHQPQKPSIGATSEWSHMQLAPHAEAPEEVVDEGEWQEMPALATHRIYDDWGKVLAKEYGEIEEEMVNTGGARKGYTRVLGDEDAQSATSMDDDTAYLFKGQGQYARNTLDDEDEEGRDLLSQMQTTKELLTEGQRIAYVGLVRLSIVAMSQRMAEVDKFKNAKKSVELAEEGLKMWGQKTMVKLYGHMEVSTQEQVMVEQLSDHGVIPADLTPTLMQNARVKNPKAESTTSQTAPSAEGSRRASLSKDRNASSTSLPANASSTSSPAPPTPTSTDAPPAYTEQKADDFTMKDADEFAKEKDIDLDLRWTVLCDLFLLLIADSTYDARSRTLLEKVASALSVDWTEICRFEKRVTDALEMQEQADKENWNEEEHMAAREKAAKRRRMMVMGLCTAGGGLVIGLSAGMLAPVIGAGLAAGFTAIGVSGTAGFLGGTGAAALIGTTGSLIGANIGLKGSNRRTGAVKTFEYRPLFNNKRVNLIVTVAGWMTGTVDDVRLPFSTVDPIMGDIYSVNWEPEMLQSTGQTVQILGTEALTQTIQQILGATFLTTLMAGLSLPLVLSKLAYLIDNPWTVSLARADAAGLILADSLIDRNLGARPVTLVGFSLGSRVIFSCLKEMAKRGALGLIQNVYMFGSPVVVKKEEWTKARSIVAGRFVNGYVSNDWILAYLFRATAGGIMRVAGLNTVEIAGIENIDVTADVPGHMAYRGMMPLLLDKVGWVVESIEFTEIEDPDPENHEQRQRELINEIEEARKELEEKGQQKKGIAGFFSRRKNAQSQKKSWETYDERNAKVLDGDNAESERVAAENSTVMFDVDAIRKEALALALEGGNMEEIKGHMQIREIESTLPTLKITSPNLSLDGKTDSNTNSPVRRSVSTSREKQSNGHISPVSPIREQDPPSMSFEPSSAGEKSSSSAYPPRSSSYSETPTSEKEKDDERPALNRNHNTAPVVSSSASSRAQTPPLVETNQAHDPTSPWGKRHDEDEDEFGQEEGEVSMSFE